MFDRIVALAVACAIACFLFIVLWPLLDDDPPTALQAAYYSGGLVLVAIGAFVYWTRN